MSVLTAHHLGKSYGHHDVFSDITLDIPPGSRIALVGPNGSGKTTLLRLLAGLEEPSAGAVHQAKGLRIGFLPQRADLSATGRLWEATLEVFTDLQAQAAALRRQEAAIAEGRSGEPSLAQYGRALEAFELAGGYTYEQRTRRVLSGLGFDEDDIQRPVSQLSGGQKTRAQLARLLLDAPDLLLLDEPTNHLDLAGIEWLEGYLKSWKGSLVLVAHDRAFLDATVDQVWDLVWGQLERYRGNYSAYVQQKTDRLARQQVEHEKQQQVIAKTEEFIRRNMAGQLSRQAKGRQKRLDRLQRIERVRTYRPLNLSLGDVARSGDLVLGLYDLSAGYRQEAPLVTVEELELRRGDRVALLGPNGSGKTTLLRTVIGEIPALSGRVRIGAAVQSAYFAQGHTELEPDKTVLETIVDNGVTSTSQARDLLGRYRFSGDDVVKRVGDLSGGEQARVALAILALQGANFLLLDEPTNHLDIPSQEVLQEVFTGFAGSILIVTHDRYLIRTVTPSVWAIEDGQVRVFEDGYEAYRAWRDQQRQSPEGARAARHEEALTALEKQRQARRTAEREAARQARRRDELEERIRRLETRLADLEAQLALASTEQAVERVRQLGVEYSQVEATLDTLMLAWAELAP